MRYWERPDGTVHIVTRPYRTTLCGEPAEDGQLVGQVRPSRRGIAVTGLCEACRTALRERADDTSARS